MDNLPPEWEDFDFDYEEDSEIQKIIRNSRIDDVHNKDSHLIQAWDSINMIGIDTWATSINDPIATINYFIKEFEDMELYENCALLLHAKNKL